jgi:hypothetical protein
MKRVLLFRVALSLAAIAALTIPSAVFAYDYNWDAGGTDDYWNTPENWKDDTVPVDNAADRVNIGGGYSIDLNGATPNLPSMPVYTSSSIADGPGTGSITCDFIQPGSVEIHPAIISNRVQTNRGSPKFYGTINTGTISLYMDGNIYFYNDANATTEMTFVGQSFYSPVVYLQPDPSTPTVYPTLTTPHLELDGVRGNFHANGNVDADTVLVTDGYKYHVKRDGAIGDATTAVTLSDSGYLGFDVAVTNFPQVTVGAYGILSGNLTGATFGGGGNVTFLENSVYAPTTGPATAPTQANTGVGAIVYEGMDLGSKTVYTSGDDGTNIYKGPAIGHWSPATSSGFTVQAISNTGPVQFLVAGSCGTWDNPKIGGGTIWIGDDKGTPGDNSDDDRSALIKVKPAGEGGLWLDYALNQNVDYAIANNSYVTEFNIVGVDGCISGRVGFTTGSNREMIREEQTFNLSNVSMSGGSHWSNWYLGGNMHGTLTLSNSVFGSPNASNNGTFDSDDGYLTFKDTVVIPMDTGNLGWLEPLGSRFSYDADARLVLKFGNNDLAAFDYTTNPVMADMMQHADITHSSYGVTRFQNDVQLGHEKYFIGSMDQANGNGFEAKNGTERILSAGNAPTGTQNVLGFAAAMANLPIKLEIYAPGCKIVCGTDDPDRILYAPWDFENVVPENVVQFYDHITAESMDVLSGSARVFGGVNLNSTGGAPFVINMLGDAKELWFDGAGDFDNNNPVTINATTGDTVLFNAGGVIDASNTTIIAGENLGYLRAGANSSVLMLANLEMNTEVRYGSNNWTAAIEVSGRLSGNGYFGGNGSHTKVMSGGTLAPGSSIGKLGNGSFKIILDDATTYELEIADPSGDAGVGYDTIALQTVEAIGEFAIELIADNALQPGDTSLGDQYIIATANTFTGDFVVKDGGTGNVTVQGLGWDTSLATLTISTNNPKELILSNVVFLGTFDPDIDGINGVNAVDLQLLLSNYIPGGGGGGGVNGYNSDNLEMLLAAYGTPASAEQVPEPASMVMLLLGAIGLLTLRRRK